MLKAAPPRTRLFFSCFRRHPLNRWPGALGAVALGTLLATGCGDPEPHYLPPLPDLAMPGPPATQGLPCEVSKLLATHCLGCHGQPPAAAPIALVSYADLTAKSAVDSTKKVAERALVRMLDNMDPMPPGPSATVAQGELAPMQTWVSSGTPMVSCATK